MKPVQAGDRIITNIHEALFEEFLLISGDLTDNDGTEYRDGDLLNSESAYSR